MFKSFLLLIAVVSLHASISSAQSCPFKTKVNCDSKNRFPSFDGSCNNLQSPWLGKAQTPFKRYLPPAYEDGRGSPKTMSVTGKPLPNPRVISRELFTDNHRRATSYSHLIALFGQFLAHDLTSAAVSSAGSGGVLDCSCNSNNPECMSISMPSNETIMRISCLKFTRSSAAFPNSACNLGHREQLNLLTSFIDGTQIYGPSVSRSSQLRSFQGGQLKTSPGANNRPFMVQATDRSCVDTDATRKCFAAGEGRTNENMGLTSVHTLFLREHNRVASELAKLNPDWSDERLFQESRKIVIAIIQNIVYSEWLPTIVGFNNAALFDLMPLRTNQYYKGYDSNVNPQMAAEFSTSAFRFGHTLVKNHFKRFNAHNREMAPMTNLSACIFRPVEAYNSGAGGLDSIFLGLINEPSEKYDTNYVDTLQNHLFQFKLSDGTIVATDLAATNINRGRDHGLRSYNDVRQKCGLPKAKNFNDLVGTIPADVVQKLAKVYDHVDDIDCYVGGLAELPTSGALIGPSFACIVSSQFKDLKKGDRFYYENGPSPTAFTLDQLREIRKSTMSKVICNNFDLDEIQTNAFLLPLASNGRISCSWVPQYDLAKWKGLKA